MKTKDLIEKLSSLVDALKELDPELPAGIMFDAPHTCCNCGDGYCYASGEEVEIYDLAIAKDERYNKKSKKHVTHKIWLKGC